MRSVLGERSEGVSSFALFIHSLTLHAVKQQDQFTCLERATMVTYREGNNAQVMHGPSLQRVAAWVPQC